MGETAIRSCREGEWLVAETRERGLAGLAAFVQPDLLGERADRAPQRVVESSGVAQIVRRKASEKAPARCNVSCWRRR